MMKKLILAVLIIIYLLISAKVRLHGCHSRLSGHLRRLAEARIFLQNPEGLRTSRNDKNINNVVLLMTVLVTVLTGCHTIHGVGQDIESAGESIQKATDK